MSLHAKPWGDQADRRSICFRRNKSLDRREDGITMTPHDLDALELHPATLQYSRRVTNESRFWSLDQNKLSMCFGEPLSAAETNLLRPNSVLLDEPKNALRFHVSYL